MSEIVWLASYPKSGNTWLRVFLANFERDSGQPVDINAIDFGAISSDRQAFEDAVGASAADLTQAEIELYRPSVFRHMASRSPRTLYLKIHDAYTRTAAGEPSIPSDVTRGAIYVVRNPLDVTISYAHHFGGTVDDAINRLADDTMALSRTATRLRPQLKQRLLSWSGHVASWFDQDAFPLHLLRYEDMCSNPIEAFSAVVDFLGWTADLARVERAVTFSCFETLRAQEERNGFKEREPGSLAFFRKGKPGSWRDLLTPLQVERVVDSHRQMMERLGYLSESFFESRHQR